MAGKLRRRKGEEPESSLPPISMVDLAARPSRPRDADRITRRKLDTWDRVNYLVLLSLLFSVFWWQKLANNPIKTSYTLHGHTLTSVRSAKYLGCTFITGLRWNEHINNICNKANRTIGFLKRNLNISATSVKENAYKALVRPLVEYASPVWDPYHQNEIDRLEMVQRRAARYVTNRHGNHSSVKDMLDHLGWRSLERRRKDARLALLYKIEYERVAISKEG